MTRRGRSPGITRAIANGLFVMLVASCRLVAGIDDRVVEDEPTIATCSRARAIANACTACEGASCCASIERCVADPACTRMLACLETCAGDVASVTACRLRCGRTLPTSFDDATAELLSCQSTHCAQPCALACGGYIHPNALCEACAKGSCCTEAAECSASRECLALTSCERACVTGDGPCRLRCARDHSPGVALRTHLDECIQRSCAAPCYDSAWACLGAPARETSSGPYLVRLRTVDIATSMPVTGVAIRFCADTDTSCEGPPLATTDPNGLVDLTLPDFRGGCLYVTGATEETACVTVGPNASFTTTTVVPLIRRADRERVFGGAWTPGSAGVLAFVHDCAGQPGRAVQVTSLAPAPPARTSYWRSGRFVNDAFDTDESGLAAIVGLAAPATRTVRAELAASLPPVGQAPVVLRPDVLSYAGFGP